MEGCGEGEEEGEENRQCLHCEIYFFRMGWTIVIVFL